MPPDPPRHALLSPGGHPGPPAMPQDPSRHAVRSAAGHPSFRMPMTAALVAAFATLAMLVRLGLLVWLVQLLWSNASRAHEGLAVTDQAIGQALTLPRVAGALHRGGGLADDPARLAPPAGRIRGGEVTE